VNAPEKILEWRLDPVAFVLEVFGPGYEAEQHKPLVLDRWQERALRYLVQHEPHDWCDGSPAKGIAIRAAKGPGRAPGMRGSAGGWRRAIRTRTSRR
jgi:hypothetical protein